MKTVDMKVEKEANLPIWSKGIYPIHRMNYSFLLHWLEKSVKK